MTGKLILLVEDNPDDEALTLRALRSSNIANEVVVVHDGAEAIDFLLGPNRGDLHRLPEIVLLDLNLPKVNGFEVLKRIRSDPRTQSLPVVILTTSDEDRDLVESYKLGANSYVQKPVDFEEFRKAIKQLGMYWLVLNLGPPLNRM